ncbi:interferon lambda receptor 1 isoform X1 [Myotis lucifugus]|uniref:interferon lambda receptor 1 isoform X1 n=2 Tax=Myotis lucifugus TaxID=59463 RepID=UPI0003C440C0|nr:interferon lambda receptor 1 isoform X1 [Myotis lucifugus]
MTRAGPWALLLLYLLPSAEGRPHLAPPQNVTLLSRNFGVYLTWLPGPGNPQNVTYRVAYQSFLAAPERWRKVEKCARTKELTCSLMCLEKQDLFNKFKGRVRAVSPSAKSPWVESKYLEYLFEVEPAPPVLVVTQTEEVLKVNATYQLPPCMPPSDLKYEVDFWKEGTGNKTRFPATSHGQPVQIPLQADASGYHCLSARTIYTCGDPKYSEFSKPTCFSLGTPGVHWAFLVLLPLLLPLLLVTATGCVIWRSFRGNPWFQRAKMPQALDFSGHRYPVATFQPSGPESLEDLTLCPQKELTRRVRLTPRVRAPATIQAGSEDDDDEEDDADANVTVQPYIVPRGFLEQEPQTPGHSEAGVQVEGCPACDASDGSWASTGGSSLLEEAGSSGYLAKKGPDRGLGRSRCPEPLPVPEFSKDLGSLEELQRNSISWASWGSSPRPDLVPGEPPVSLRTLTVAWDSNAEEEEEEEEEEEDGEESETEDSGAGSWGANSLQRTGARSRTLGHYMAR